MSVAVKNPQTSSPGPFDRLTVGIVAGVVYVVGGLALLFAGLPRLWWDGLHLPQTAVSTTLLVLVGLLAGAGLCYLGGLFVARHPTPGLRAGIFTALFTLLVVLLLTRWVSILVEGWVYDSRVMPGGESAGIALTAAVGAALLVAAVRFLFMAPTFPQKMVAFEEQGWFSARSFKRSQGQRVRRGTILGVLILFGCGIYALESHQALAGSKSWGLNVPFTGTARVTALNDAKVVFGDRDLPFTVDQATFREKNNELKKDWVKIDDPKDTDFRKGQVVRKSEYEEVARPLRDKNESVPTFKAPDPATGPVSYATLTLLPDVRYTLPILLAALGLWLAWRLVNMPAFADFLIATEAELNKVSWTTRRRLIQDTIVVLVTVFLFTLFLFVVDVAWGKILSWKQIGVIKIPEGSQTQQKDQNW